MISEVEFTKEDAAYVEVHGVRVPYAVFDNEDDVTTVPGQELEKRLEKTLNLLWDRWNTRQAV